MSHGELLMAGILHLSFAIGSLSVGQHFSKQKSFIRAIHSPDAYSHLKKLCTNSRPVKLNFPLFCLNKAEWKVNGGWQNLCQNLTPQKTYPMRWYKISGTCIITIGGRKVPIIENIIEIKT